MKKSLLIMLLASVATVLPLRSTSGADLGGVWAEVRLLSHEEAASCYGYSPICNGYCTGEEQRPDCSGTPYAPYWCHDRETADACKSNQVTIVDYAQISWCTGWQTSPPLPKSCYYMGEASCGYEQICWWIPGEMRQ